MSEVLAKVTLLEEAPAAPRRTPEALYFALRNRKLLAGLSVVGFFLALALVGPLIAGKDPLAFDGIPSSAPSGDAWFGTTSSGQDVFAQFVYGLRASFLVGAVGGGIAAVVGVLVGVTAGLPGGAGGEPP